MLVSPVSSINPLLNILAHVVNEFFLSQMLSHLGEMDGGALLNNLSPLLHHQPEDQPAEEGEPGLHGSVRDPPDHAGCPPHGLLPAEQRGPPHLGGPELHGAER